MKKILTLNNLFLLAIFCTPLYLVRLEFFGFPTNLFELIAFLAIAISFFQKDVLVKKVIQIPRSLLFAFALIFSGVLFSILFNDNKLVGFGILKSWFLLPIFFTFFLYAHLRSRRDLEKIFLSIYLSSFLVGIASLSYKICGITTYDNRLSAFYLSPNHLAMYLSIGIFFGLYFFLKSFTYDFSVKKFLFYFSPLLILLLSVYYTYSYGAWLAIMVSLFSILFFTVNTRKYLLVSLLFLSFLSIVVFIFQIRTEKFSSLIHFSERSSLESRKTIWTVSQMLISENPIIGIGPGNFQSAYLSLQPKFAPYLEWAVPQPHNIFLAFWLQSGLLGLIGFSMLLFLIFKILLKILRDRKDAALAAPLFGFFLYTIMHGLLDTTYWKNDLAFLFWVCVFSVLFLSSIKESN